MKKQIVLFSHGFGVDKTARGLFTDIAAGLPDAECVMVDMNGREEETGNMVVQPFSVQVGILQQQYSDVRASNPDAAISLVCHSQGCVIGALAKLAGLWRVIFLAPPIINKVSGTVERARKYPETHVDYNGTSRLKRSDGSVTVIPADYWREREGLDFVALYNAYAAVVNVHIVLAEKDGVAGMENVSFKYEIVAGDHDFNGAARAGAVQRVKELLDE